MKDLVKARAVNQSVLDSWRKLYFHSKPVRECMKRVDSAKSYFTCTILKIVVLKRDYSFITVRGVQ